MKKSFHYALAAALLSVSMAFIACDPEPGPDPKDVIENDGTYYTFVYKNNPVTPLDTVVYSLSQAEVADDFTTISFVYNNLTNGALNTTQKVEILQGNTDLAKDEYICGGGSCPWNKEPFSLAPGLNNDMPLTIDIHPSEIGSTNTALFRLTVGEAPKFSHATIIYLRVNK